MLDYMANSCQEACCIVGFGPLWDIMAIGELQNITRLIFKRAIKTHFITLCVCVRRSSVCRRRSCP